MLKVVAIISLGRWSYGLPSSRKARSAISQLCIKRLGWKIPHKVKTSATDLSDDLKEVTNFCLLLNGALEDFGGKLDYLDNHEVLLERIVTQYGTVELENAQLSLFFSSVGIEVAIQGLRPRPCNGCASFHCLPR
jgi:hypothetical protein